MDVASITGSIRMLFHWNLFCCISKIKFSSAVTQWNTELYFSGDLIWYFDGHKFDINFIWYWTFFCYPQLLEIYGGDWDNNLCVRNKTDIKYIYFLPIEQLSLLLKKAGCELATSIEDVYCSSSQIEVNIFYQSGLEMKYFLK